MANILIIDDDPGICHVLCRTVRNMGHTAAACHSLGEARRLLHEAVFDVLLLDVCLPDGNGLEGLESLAAHPSQPEIVVITGLGIPEDAEQAIRNGAWDYLQKGSPREMSQTLEQVLRYRHERRAAPPAAAPPLYREGIVGDSPQLRRCLESLAQMAVGQGNVLIYGETGTGKELFARALHHNSACRNGPFVAVDCAALPLGLVESLLLGHVRGAFTGADCDLRGLIAQADGGTLFLDEVGELPLQAQVAFLRVLQQRTFRRVGGSKEEHSNFRLVAATNRDLDHMVEIGAFRADLLFRLHGAGLTLPPLRERRDDIVRIAEHRTAVLCQRAQLPPKTFSPAFLELLLRHSWPGNVRELLNALDCAVNAAQHETTLFPIHLPHELRARALRQRLGDDPIPCPPAASPPARPRERETPLPRPLPTLARYRDAQLRQLEQQYIACLMDDAANDISLACTISGLSQSRLYALLKKYSLYTPGRRR